VLVADDDMVCQRVARMLLHRLGVEAGVASDGAAAVLELQNGAAGVVTRYDAVFLDSNMPRMSGAEAAAAIRAAGYQARNGGPLPIISTTADAMTRVGGGGGGGALFDDAIIKPFSTDTLLGVLRRHGVMVVDATSGPGPRATSVGTGTGMTTTAGGAATPPLASSGAAGALAAAAAAAGSGMPALRRWLWRSSKWWMVDACDVVWLGAQHNTILVPFLTRRLAIQWHQCCFLLNLCMELQLPVSSLCYCASLLVLVRAAPGGPSACGPPGWARHRPLVMGLPTFAGPIRTN